MKEGETLAVIDCGSHSTRLLIGKVSDLPGDSPAVAPEILHREMKVTRLGKGLGDTSNNTSGSRSSCLLESAIVETADCIRGYSQILEELKPKRVLAVATAAARTAQNSSDLLIAVKDALSILPGGIFVEEPVILEGEREAELAFLGATAGIKDCPPPYLTLDIGGGSSEFGFGSASCEATMSLDIGSFNLTEKHITSDPPQPEELYACLSLVETYLSDLAIQIPEVKSARTLIGMAGTITSAAAVELGYYDPKAIHHFHLEKAAGEDVFRTLSVETIEERKSNPGLHPDRAAVIVAGLCILIKTMRFFGFEECVVSESDLMDGIIIEMSNEHK